MRQRGKGRVTSRGVKLRVTEGKLVTILEGTCSGPVRECGRVAADGLPPLRPPSEILVEQQSPQEDLVCSRAGLVINELSFSFWPSLMLPVDIPRGTPLLAKQQLRLRM